MNQTRELKLNTSVSILNQIIIIISGLILPRLILSNYGIEIHGLVGSINQFLSIIMFLELGVGTVVQSALYRPLVNNDNYKMSSVLSAARSYFQKIAYILMVYVIVLIIFHPFLIDTNYGYRSTAFLIIALSISRFGQYYFGLINELLLSADQKAYIQLLSEIVVVILNLIISIVLIYFGATIEIVKLGSGLVYLSRPFFLSYYVNKNYDLNYDVEVKEDPLPQKWNGMGQHIANTIQNSTDIIVITLFSSLQDVSVYSVYNMIVAAMKTMINSFTTGIRPFMGNLLANNEINLLNSYFDKIEWMIQTIVVYLYGMTIVLINEFIQLYTSGVGGNTYDRPIFSIILVLSGAIYSIRSPYQSMVFAAGHFKQTERSSYIEAGLNILISVFLINRFGLVGVAFGTLISMAYRTLYLIIYLSRNIVFRPIKKFLKHVFVDFISIITIMTAGTLLLRIYPIKTIFDWIIVAFILAFLNMIFLFIINLVFYRKVMKSVINSILKK